MESGTEGELVDKKNEFGWLKYVALINYIGFSIAAPIMGGVLLGRYLDERLDTRFIFMFILTVLGVLTGFRNLFYITTKKSGKK